MKPPTPSRKMRRDTKSNTKKTKTPKSFGTEKNELKKDDKKIPEDGREENLLKSVEEVLEAPLKAFESGVTRIFKHQIKKEIKSKRRVPHYKKTQRKGTTKAPIGSYGYLALA